MSSTSDRFRTTVSVDARIVGALERLSQVFRTLLWEKAKQSPLGLTLSPIQIQVLAFLRMQKESRTGLIAREFDLTDATVSDVIRSLMQKGLVERERSLQDARVLILRLTPLGEEAAAAVADWSTVVEKHLGAHSDAEKIIVMRFLLELIESLHRSGVISVSRMCSTCRYFDQNPEDDPSAPHYCQLMELPLREQDLRVDCPEHVAGR